MKFGKSLPKSRSGVEVYCLKTDSQLAYQSSSLAVSLLDCEPVRLHNTFSGDFFVFLYIFSGDFLQDKTFLLIRKVHNSNSKIADK